MSHEEKVYIFHCDTVDQCYWRTDNYRLQIERRNHIMLTIPSSLIDTENCDCKLDSTACGCKHPVPLDKCQECADGYWRLNENGCESKFLVIIL